MWQPKTAAATVKYRKVGIRRSGFKYIFKKNTHTNIFYRWYIARANLLALSKTVDIEWTECCVCIVVTRVADEKKSFLLLFLLYQSYICLWYGWCLKWTDPESKIKSASKIKWAFLLVLLLPLHDSFFSLFFWLNCETERPTFRL